MHNEYLGTRIEKVLNEMKIECNFNLDLGEYYGMIDNVVITRNYGIKLPKKKATGIEGIFGITKPIISFLDIVNKINEKLEIIPSNNFPSEEYYARYSEYFGSFVEKVNLYLEDIVQKSKRVVYFKGSRPVFCGGIYNRIAKKLASQGLI